ncbi:hypothetical protein Hanom_Chr04g00375921 [Helianthus anomalus]
MKLTSLMKLARFRTFWIKIRKNKHLDESRKTSETLGMKMTFYSCIFKLTVIALALCIFSDLLFDESATDDGVR